MFSSADHFLIDTVTAMARIVRVREARNPPTGVVTHPLLPEMRIEIVVVMAVIEEEVEGVMMTDGGTTVTTTGGEEMTAVVTIGEADAASTAMSHHVTDTGTTGEDTTGKINSITIQKCSRTVKHPRNGKLVFSAESILHFANEPLCVGTKHHKVFHYTQCNTVKEGLSCKNTLLDFHVFWLLMK